MSKKLVATLLVIFIAAQEISFAAPAGSLSDAPIPLTLSDLTARKTKALAGAFNRLELPAELGKVGTVYAGPSKEMVIHIQDLHINETAQKTIAKIIEHVSSRYGIRMVQVEGASGELSHGLLSRYPGAKARALAASSFLKEGWITGPEYLAITKNPGLILFGVENKELYEQNRGALLTAMSLGAGIEDSLNSLEKNLNSLATLVFSKNLRSWMNARRRFEESSETISNYTRFLRNMCARESLDCETPQISLLHKLETIEHQARKERRFKSESDLSRHIAQILKSEGGLDTGIFDEIKKTEDRIEARLASAPDTARLYKLFDVAEVYRKMISLSLTREHVEFLYANRKDFSPGEIINSLIVLADRHHAEIRPANLQSEKMERALSAYETFYRLALTRDQALVNGAVRSMRMKRQKAVILVTGGFHTPAIEEHLKKDGISFCTITPAVNEKIDQAKDQRIYFKAMQVPASPSARLAGARDPTLQLQVPTRLPAQRELRLLGTYTTLPGLLQPGSGIDYLTTMMIETAVIGFRVNPGITTTDLTQAFKNLKPQEAPFARLYQHLHQPDTLLLSVSTLSGKAFVPYDSQSGFGLDMTWKPESVPASSWVNPRRKSFSFSTPDKVRTEIQFLTEPELADLASKNFARRAPKTKIAFAKRSEVRDNQEGRAPLSSFKLPKESISGSLSGAGLALVDAKKLKPDLQSLALQKASDLYRTLFPAMESTDPYYGDWRKFLLQPERDLYLFLDADGEIAGFVSGIRHSDKHAEVERIGSRKDGITGKGTFMMDFYLDHLRSLKIPLVLWKAIENPPSKPFYQIYLGESAARGMLSFEEESGIYQVNLFPRSELREKTIAKPETVQTPATKKTKDQDQTAVSHVMRWLSAAREFAANRKAINPIPEILTVALMFALGTGLWSFPLLAIAVRFIWLGSIFVHGFGHVFFKWIVDKGHPLKLSESFEGITPAEFLAGLIPFYSIFTPGLSDRITEPVPTGDEDPAKVSFKAIGGPAMNLLALALSVFLLASLPAISGPVALGFYAAAILNGAFATLSVSDFVSFRTGLAPMGLACGYLDYVGPIRRSEGSALLPDQFIESITNSTLILSGRGTQAYGFEIKAMDRKGNVILLGSKDVNPKRAVLHDRLRQDIERELEEAEQAGFLPLDGMVDYSSHLRFGTSSHPSKKETHPHPSEEELVHHYSWSDPSQPVAARSRNFQVSVRHNGDNDGIKTEEEILKDHPIFAFGKETDYNEIRVEMNRMLYKDTTKGDSPVIASMLALFNTQGRWDASARLAYLMMAGTLKDSFAGLTEPDQINQIIKVWGDVLEEQFLKHKDSMFVVQDGKRLPDKDYIEGHLLPDLRKAVLTDPRIREDKYLKAFGEEELNAFTETALFTFLHNDMYRTIQMFMATALPSSTFGLSVSTTLEPRMKFWVAKGQPGAVGYNPDTGAYIAASDPGAVFGGLNERSRFFTLNDDHGEIVRLNMEDPENAVMQIFSLARHRELTDDEIKARWIPVGNNPYIQLPDTGGVRSSMKRDISELNKVLVAVDNGFDISHRADKKRPSNRLSADSFTEELVDMALEHRDWREAKIRAWVESGRDINDYEEEKSQEVDILFIGEGPSYDVAMRKKEDIEALMPGLHIQVILGNTYMANKDLYYSGKGAPFKIGKRTIVFAVSQSGMTFSTVDAIRDAEIMRKNGYLQDVFIMTGEWFTILGRSIGQEYFPDSNFTGRIFSNMSGRRLSEAATMASATDFFFTKLFLDVFKTLHEKVAPGTAAGGRPAYAPFNMKITPEAVEKLNESVDPLLHGGISSLTGHDENENPVASETNQELLAQGQDYANHISEQLFTVIAVRVYTFLSVLFHLPIFKLLALIVSLTVVIASNGGSLAETLQALPVLEVGLLTAVFAAAHLLDTIFYTFQDVIFLYFLRWLQGRAIPDRMGPRFLAVGSPVWQLLRDYFRASLLSAPGLLQFSGVDGRKLDGDFMHRFKDAPRGTLVLIQFDDGPDIPIPLSAISGAGKMSINQSDGVRNLSAGPHILVHTINPALTERYKHPAVAVSDGSDVPVMEGLEDHDIFRMFHSRWFNELKFLVAGQVMAAEMAQNLAEIKIPFYVRRTDTPSSRMLDAVLNWIASIYSRVILGLHSLFMQILFRTPAMDQAFREGEGQSGLAVFTTQLVAPRPNKMGVEPRNIRSVAAALTDEGIDKSIPWIPKAGVVSYIFAQLYDPKEKREAGTRKLTAAETDTGILTEARDVPTSGLPPQRFDFPWGSVSVSAPEASSRRSEMRTALLDSGTTRTSEDFLLDQMDEVNELSTLFEEEEKRREDEYMTVLRAFIATELEETGNKLEAIAGDHEELEGFSIAAAVGAVVEASFAKLAFLKQYGGVHEEVRDQVIELARQRQRKLEEQAVTRFRARIEGSAISILSKITGVAAVPYDFEAELAALNALRNAAPKISPLSPFNDALKDALALIESRALELNTTYLSIPEAQEAAPEILPVLERAEELVDLALAEPLPQEEIAVVSPSGTYVQAGWKLSKVFQPFLFLVSAFTGIGSWFTELLEWFKAWASSSNSSGTKWTGPSLFLERLELRAVPNATSWQEPLAFPRNHSPVPYSQTRVIEPPPQSSQTVETVKMDPSILLNDVIRGVDTDDFSHGVFVDNPPGSAPMLLHSNDTAFLTPLTFGASLFPEESMPALMTQAVPSPMEVPGKEVVTLDALGRVSQISVTWAANGAEFQNVLDIHYDGAGKATGFTMTEAVNGAVTRRIEGVFTEFGADGKPVKGVAQDPNTGYNIEFQFDYPAEIAGSPAGIVTRMNITREDGSTVIVTVGKADITFKKNEDDGGGEDTPSSKPVFQTTESAPATLVQTSSVVSTDSPANTSGSSTGSVELTKPDEENPEGLGITPQDALDLLFGSGWSWNPEVPGNGEGTPEEPLLPLPEIPDLGNIPAALLPLPGLKPPAPMIGPGESAEDPFANLTAGWEWNALDIVAISVLAGVSIYGAASFYQNQKKKQARSEMRVPEPRIAWSPDGDSLTLSFAADSPLRISGSSGNPVPEITLHLQEDGTYLSADKGMKAVLDRENGKITFYAVSYSFTFNDGSTTHSLNELTSKTAVMPPARIKKTDVPVPVKTPGPSGSGLSTWLAVIATALAIGAVLYVALPLLQININWPGFPALLAWVGQNVLHILYWGGILGAAVSILIALQEPSKKASRISWDAWMKRTAFRALFLSIISGAAFAALWLQIAPLPLLTFIIWLGYISIAAGYFFPRIFTFGLAILTIPLRWIPSVASSFPFNQKVLPALMVTAALIAGGYLLSRTGSITSENSDQQVARVTAPFSPEAWPENPAAEVKKDGNKKGAPLAAEAMTLKFENQSPLLFDSEPGEITVPLRAQKEGYVEVDPASGIKSTDWQNGSKAFPVKGGAPLLKLKRPATESKATDTGKLVGYLKDIDRRYSKLYNTGVVSKGEELYNKSTILMREIANYNDAQEVSVFGEIRVPFREGEEGWILPGYGQRPVGTAASTTILARAQSKHRLTVRAAVPIYVWQQYDMTRAGIAVTLNGKTVRARIIHLTVEPRLDGKLLLTFNLISDGVIFDWNTVNNRPAPVDFTLELQPREGVDSYSGKLPQGSLIRSYAEFDERVRVNIQPAEAVGRVSFNEKEAMWVGPDQVIAGVAARDRERIKALAAKGEDFAVSARAYLENIQKLIAMKAAPIAPAEVKRFAEDFIMIRELLNKIRFMDSKAPQGGLLYLSPNAEGQAVHDRPVAHILTPQIFIHHKIEKTIPVEIGDIVIVRRASTGEETLGVVRQLNKELGKRGKDEDQGRYQEALIETNSSPKLWFADREYGIQVIYSNDRMAQDWLRAHYARHERFIDLTYRAAGIKSLPPIFPVRFVPAATDEDRRLLINALETPRVVTPAPEARKPEPALTPAQVKEQSGEIDPSAVKSGNPEIQRILGESNGEERRGKMRIFLQNQKIPVGDIQHILLHGTADTAQMALDYLLDQRRVSDLISVHRALQAKAPELDMTKLSREHILELIETDETALKRLVQLAPADPKRAEAQEFFISLLVLDHAVWNVKTAPVVRKVLASDFWRTREEKMALARSLEAAGHKNAAALVRNAVFADLAFHTGWTLGGPQKDSKEVNYAQRHDAWIAGRIQEPGIWERVHSAEKNDSEDRKWLAHSPWVLTTSDPKENFKSRISGFIYDRALKEYESLEAAAANGKAQPLTVLTLSEGPILSDPVFKRLDNASQRDYIQSLNLHGLERFLTISELENNGKYRERRGQAVNRLLADKSAEAKFILARIIVHTRDTDLILQLFNKDVHNAVIEEAGKLRDSHEPKPEKLAVFQQALARLSGPRILTPGAEGNSRLAFRTLLGTLTDFEVQDLALGRHELKKLLLEAGVSETSIAAAANEELSRRSTIWAIERTAEWSRLSLNNKVLTPEEAALKNLRDALAAENFDPRRVRAAWIAGMRQHPRVFEKLTQLSEFRHKEILKGEDRDEVTHIEVYRLPILLGFGILGIFAGLVWRGVSTLASKPYSPNKKRGKKRSEMRQPSEESSSAAGGNAAEKTSDAGDAADMRLKIKDNPGIVQWPVITNYSNGETWTTQSHFTFEEPENKESSGKLWIKAVISADFTRNLPTGGSNAGPTLTDVIIAQVAAAGYSKKEFQLKLQRLPGLDAGIEVHLYFLPRFQAKSELRDLDARTALLEALDSKERMLKEIRMANELDFQTYEKQAMQLGLDLDTVLADAARTLKGALAETGTSVKGGEIILNYRADFHTETFAAKWAEFMRTHADVRQLSILKAEDTPLEEWNRLKTALRRMPDFRRLRLAFGDETGFESVEAMAVERLRARKLSKAALLQVLEPAGISPRNRKHYDEFLLGMAPLADEAVLVLGGQEPIQGAKRWFTPSEVLDSLFLQRKLIEQSA